jgi:ADP-glucose pyrophosphorylase
MRNSLLVSPPGDPVLAAASGNKAKSMIAIDNGRTFLDYLLYNARAAGYREIVLVTGEDDLDFRKHYGMNDSSNNFHGLSISYAMQRIPAGRTKPLGTVDALHGALLTKPNWKGRTFTVCNSDNLYSQRALRLLLATAHPNAMIDYDRNALQFEQSRIEQFAVIEKTAEGFLSQIIEKPTPAQLAEAKDADGRVGVSMNIFRFAFDAIFPILERVPLHPVRLEKELPSAVMMMIANDPKAMMTIPLAEEVPDLTEGKEIAHVQQFLVEKFPDFSWDRP